MSVDQLSQNASASHAVGLPRFQGLTAAEVEESRKRFGSNVLKPAEREPWWKLYLEKYEDPVIRILLIAAALAILVGSFKGEFFEGIGIVIAVFLAATLAFLNEFQAQKAFDILNLASDDDPVTVVRDHRYTEVPRRDLVVGDIVLLEAGLHDAVPADGEIIESTSLQIDEASLTGESLPVVKTPREATDEDRAKEAAYPPWTALRGTTAMDGHGVLKITAVGDSTEIGKLVLASSGATDEVTPLNAQLAQLSKIIGVVGFGIAALTFMALMIRGFLLGENNLTGTQWALSLLILASVAIASVKIWLPTYYDAKELLGRDAEPPAWLEAEGPKVWLQALGASLLLFAVGIGIGIGMGRFSASPSEWLPAEVGVTILGYFMIAVTIIVVAVPEGLAMSVTLSLAYSMKKMTASNNLVKRMHACETIGAATVICSDKTGTLTMNQMRVQEIFCPGLEGALGGEAGKRLTEGACANSTAQLSREPGVAPKPIGNPTEAAILLWMDGLGVDYLAQRNGFGRLAQLTFSTERKYMATLGTSAGSTQRVLHAKGAPEILLARCSSILTPQGIEPIGAHLKGIEDQLKASQGRAMRTLGFAFRLCDETLGVAIEDMMSDLVWIGYLAIADPVRDEVPSALLACRRAGIQVKIITGDNALTAREIGRQIGLVEGHENTGALMTGTDFGKLNETEAGEAVEGLKILARGRPADKMRVVRLLQQRGHVVAVTGDGTNDAPALHQANVGLAMGRTGTSAAREASDIVLLDDSFQSIVNAVVWGRSLYLNIQRFILFQLTINVAALLIALLGPFLGVEIPLTVIQMLWINLIMDTFAALALATEPPDESVLDQSPRKSTASIVSPAMTRGIFGVAGIFVVALLGFLLIIKSEGVTNYELTLFFATFVMLQFWNLFNARRLGSNESALTGMTKNIYFLLIAVAIFLGTILLVQLGGEVFRTVPLTLEHWLIIIGSTSVVLWGGEILRAINRARSANPIPTAAIS